MPGSSEGAASSGSCGAGGHTKSTCERSSAESSLGRAVEPAQARGKRTGAVTLLAPLRWPPSVLARPKERRPPVPCVPGSPAAPDGRPPSPPFRALSPVLALPAARSMPPPAAASETPSGGLAEGLGSGGLSSPALPLPTPLDTRLACAGVIPTPVLFLARSSSEESRWAGARPLVGVDSPRSGGAGLWSSAGTCRTRRASPMLFRSARGRSPFDVLRPPLCAPLLCSVLFGGLTLLGTEEPAETAAASAAADAGMPASVTPW